MKVIRSIAELRAARQGFSSVGFVPTMGALHEGHLSLFDLAKRDTEMLVASIFVNPIQFNSPGDYENYPRVEERDLELARARGVDLLFIPSVEELYPSGISGFPAVRAGSLAEGLCGEARPGHFDGVCTVVSMLLNLVTPEKAYFGEKDYQQLRVIQQLVGALHFDVEIVAGKTVRDSDGLALSSRNLRLTAEERFHALYIPQTLERVRELVQVGETRIPDLLEMVVDNLEKSGGLRLEYATIVDQTTLQPAEQIDQGSRLMVAAWAGEIRLIDNMYLGA